MFIISELKSKVPVAGRLPTDDYHILEEKSKPTNGTWKWGVAIGIRKLQIQHEELKGRIIAVDILLPSTNGCGFPHRIFGVYAPWDPGSKTSFWEKMTETCRNSPHSWSLIGDLNSTVSPIERATSENRSAYTKFLRDSNGLDIWRNYPLRNRSMDWTCRSKDSEEGGSIIDRLVTSSNGIIEAHLQVASDRNDYIPVTDHRPLIARVIPDVPNGSRPTTLKLISLPNPRTRYPKLERKQKLQQFEQQTDSLAEDQGLFQMKIKDEASFITLYDALTEILNKTVDQVFRRNQVYRRGTIRDVTSTRIEAIKAEARRVGGAILLLRMGATSRVLNQTRQYLDRIRRSHRLLNDAELTEVLKRKRKELAKELYKERLKEAYNQAQEMDSK